MQTISDGQLIAYLRKDVDHYRHLADTYEQRTRELTERVNELEKLLFRPKKQLRPAESLDDSSLDGIEASSRADSASIGPSSIEELTRRHVPKKRQIIKVEELDGLILEHFRANVTDGACRCGIKRDPRSPKFTETKLSAFRQHVTRNRHLPEHAEFYNNVIQFAQ